MSPATGVLDDDRVLVEDEREANALYNKGAFGQPRSGGSLALELLEAVYLAEANRLKVLDGGRPVAAADLLVRAARGERGFEVRYVVYRDVRNRGYVTRASNVSDFNVYPKGALPGKSRSTHLVRALAERGAFDPVAVADEAAKGTELGKRLLLAIVDEEGDLTYYAADLADPRGGRAPKARDLRDAAPATLLSDGVVVTDAEAIAALADDEHLGRSIGAGLQLSLAEASWLVDEAGLRVADVGGGPPLPAEAFRARARALHPDFDLRYALYRDLKARAHVVKTGFKFGTHYRVYEGDPDEQHAPLLVHALAPGVRVPWPEVAGFVRLAHGVRKDVLFAVGGRYLRLRRTKP